MDIINNHNLVELAQKFKTNSPFPHVVIDNFLKPEYADAIYSQFPSHHESFWHRYSNPLEEKLACNMFEHMPAVISKALQLFNGKDVRDLFSKISGIANLKDDPTLHGGGMHCIKRGGKLDVHMDYAIHPKLNLQRRLNLILYLNKNWQEEWGGHLELWNKEMSECVKKVVPAFNRAVIFDTGEGSYHGHPEPLNCPEYESRKSLAVYYLTDPQPDVKDRYRALFVARPQDPKDAQMEEFRRLRSGLTTGEALHRAKVDNSK